MSDKPDGGLAAVAIGWLDQHLIGTANPTGRVGYVANMCTEPDFRRRGFGRITLTALLDWMRSTGTRTVNLHASTDGEACIGRSVSPIRPRPLSRSA